MNAPLATLFGGLVLDGRSPDYATIVLIDASSPTVRVREMPARHHLEMVDLFDLGREAALLEKCVQVQAPDETTQLGLKWEPATAALTHTISYEIAY
jgi:hypothetical protein